MDYRFKQSTVVIAIMSVLMIISIVIIANWRTLSGKKNNKAEPSVSEPEAVVTESSSDTFFKGTRLGNDLDAWKNDETFFDKDFKGSSEEETSDVSLNDISGNDVSGDDVSGNSVSENDTSVDSDKQKNDNEDGLSKRNTGEDDTDNGGR